MTTLLEQIRIAQRNAAGLVVISSLESKGLIEPEQLRLQATDVEFLSMRLQRVAKLVGVPIDGTHTQIVQVAGTILGQIAFALEKMGQAIAQELASQTASTSPVVSQKTSETVDKDCGNCKKFSTNSLTGGPVCISCKDYSNWEPKP